MYIFGVCSILFFVLRFGSDFEKILYVQCESLYWLSWRFYIQLNILSQDGILMSYGQFILNENQRESRFSQMHNVAFRRAFQLAWEREQQSIKWCHSFTCAFYQCEQTLRVHTILKGSAIVPGIGWKFVKTLSGKKGIDFKLKKEGSGHKSKCAQKQNNTLSSFICKNIQPASDFGLTVHFYSSV